MPALEPGLVAAAVEGGDVPLGVGREPGEDVAHARAGLGGLVSAQGGVDGDPHAGGLGLHPALGGKRQHDAVAAHEVEGVILARARGRGGNGHGDHGGDHREEGGDACHGRTPCGIGTRHEGTASRGAPSTPAVWRHCGRPGRGSEVGIRVVAGRRNPGKAVGQHGPEAGP